MNDAIDAWKRASKQFEIIDKKTRTVAEESFKPYSMKNKRTKTSWKKPSVCDK